MCKVMSGKILYPQSLDNSLKYFQRNRPFPSYASVPANNNLKSRLGAKFSYICCIFSHQASTSGYCSRELKRNSEMGYYEC